MIYVYAVAESFPHARAQITGLRDGAVEFFCHAGLLAAVTRHGSQTIEPTADNIWRHEQVIEQIMQMANLLPARFATVVANDDALRVTLERHRQALTNGLERVRGCVELGLRARWRSETSKADPSKMWGDMSGRQYMLQRADAERLRERAAEEAERLAEMLHSPLAALARASTRRLMAAPSLPFSAAYLVENPDVEPFRRQVRSLAASASDVQLLCTGPWPPYHFAPELSAMEACHV